MKENRLITSDLIYHWTFADNMSIVDNPRVKATVFGNPTFKNGIASFNGSTDYYKLKSLINLGTKHTISIKFYANNFSGNSRLMANTNIYGILLIESTNQLIYRCNNIDALTVQTIPRNQWNILDIARNGSNILIYLNGTLIFTKTDYNATTPFLFNMICWDNLNDKFNGQLEYIKIWNRQLTASEVKNNYLGKTYKALPYKPTTLFHINSSNGVIRDLTGKTSPIATNVQLPKIGSGINVMKFDGLSGNINLGTQALLGDITFMGWVNNANKGESNEGTPFTNGQILLRNSNVANNFYVLTRNNSTNTVSAANSFKPQQPTFICITSTSTGITNFYIGDKNNPPTLSGVSNQNAGTPIAGSTCYLGNRAGDDRTLNGWIGDARMDTSILTLEEITNFWSNTRNNY